MSLTHSVGKGVLRHGFLVFIFEFVLSLDLVGDHFGHGECEDPLVLGHEERDPVVAELAVLNFPLFRTLVPFVAASDAGSNLLMCQWRILLLLINFASPLGSFVKHLLHNCVTYRQLLLSNVVAQLIEREPIIVILIYCVTQLNDTFFRNLHGVGPLLEVLRRPRIISHVFNLCCPVGFLSFFSHLV